MAKQNKQELVASEQQQMTCVETHLAKGTNVHVHGKAWKPADIVNAYGRHVVLLKQAEAAREKWLAIVAQERAAAAVLRPLKPVLEQYFENTFGPGSEEAIDFGLSTPKTGTPTVGTKLLAVQKRAATREARHTMGKKERLAIHGNVDPSDATPPAVTTPANVAAPSGAQSAQPPTVTTFKPNVGANGATNGSANGAGGASGYLNGAAGGVTNGSG